MIYDYFRVTGIHDSVENYADLFTISLRNDDVQEFDSKWDGILLSMTKIPPDDILEGLYKLRIRESDKLKTVLELYDLETRQKKLRPDYHRLKTMVKRSIEQEIRNKNFGARIGNFEKNAVVKNPGNKTACTKNSWRLFAMGNGSPTGRVLEETTAVSASIRVGVEKSHTSEFVSKFFYAAECLDGPARITSKELAPIHSVKNGTLQNACSPRSGVVAKLVKSGHMHIARLMNNQEKGPKRMMTKVQ